MMQKSLVNDFLNINTFSNNKNFEGYQHGKVHKQCNGLSSNSILFKLLFFIDDFKMFTWVSFVKEKIKCFFKILKVQVNS